MSGIVHSNHIFLFPFRWEMASKYVKRKRDTEEELLNACKALENRPWKPFTYKPKDSDGFNTYNEYSYFYPFVRDVLNLETEETVVNERLYEYSGVSDFSEYIIKAKGKEYRLKIKDILLNLYENGVGVISYFLENRNHSFFGDILTINDFGRRIYPQFLGSEEPLTGLTKGSFLAQEIRLDNVASSNGCPIVENFAHYDYYKNIKKQIFILPAHIKSLLSDNFSTHYENQTEGQVLISPVLDDRMFVVCQVFNDTKIKALNTCNKDNEENYIGDEDWYKLIFVDTTTCSCPSIRMRKNLVREATYDRWGSFTYNYKFDGQLFGVSRYSFVAICGGGGMNRYVVSKHFQHLYFQLVLLCLIQRVYLVNFSNEVARIAGNLDSTKPDLDNEKKNISRLYLRYIKFVNRIYFREVTPQEQGIELYDLLQKQMRIKQNVEELDKEIQELNNYMEAKEQGELTSIASMFLPTTLLVGIFGMNYLSTNAWSTPYNYVIFVAVLLAFVFSPFLIKLVKKIQK